MDAFMKAFKYYKQRKPPPDLSHVIDFETPDKYKDMVVPVSVSSLDDDRRLSSLGLRSGSEWEIFSVKDSPGFFFIKNPFLPGVQWDLVTRCLEVYLCKPNISNLDAHMEIKTSIWDSSQDSLDKKSPLYKLRWVTIGYHYNWDTKTYSPDNKSDFPQDLDQLFVRIANTLGYEKFSPEAGIINYYHLDSTLAGHTDHSEFDLEAPLFSLSLGQSAIFLLGGKSRDDAPVPMYMRSGDIMVMAGKSRLAYHAVPRVLSPPSDQKSIPSCLKPPCFDQSQHKLLSCPSKAMDTISTNEQSEHKTVRREAGELLTKRKNLDGEECASGVSLSLEKTETDLILQYLSCSRININIRQVLRTGQSFPVDRIT
ncbi:nucleic acid dioxygenase ALKBH1-like [Actinia tenebrosa]|uniref:Nucleic acid dioxygenase ALKBH1-like n=1 Tax=Actinia tenebrosa TaxID=6105 RepID=A0A6P8IQX4_ACTTE|nr:nucleic acid dioxygenase ALKBH1-like [Actinia tenebrosa]